MRSCLVVPNASHWVRSRHPTIVTTRSSMAAPNLFVEVGAILIFILVVVVVTCRYTK